MPFGVRSKASARRRHHARRRSDAVLSALGVVRRRRRPTRSSSTARSRSGRPIRNGRSSRPRPSSIAAIYDTLLTFKGGDVSRPRPAGCSGLPGVERTPRRTPSICGATSGSRTGLRMTAADVVFSFRRLINLKGNPSFLLAGVTPSARGKYTVVLRSATPNTAHSGDRREHVARHRQLEAREAERRDGTGRTPPRPTRPSAGSTRQPRAAPGAGRTCSRSTARRRRSSSTRTRATGARSPRSSGSCSATWSRRRSSSTSSAARTRSPSTSPRSRRRSLRNNRRVR